jgi:MFS family permease
MATKTKPSRAVLGALCVGALASSSVYGLLAPVFPSEALAYGMSERAQGVVFAVFALVVFLASPAVGSWLVPRMGKRNVLLRGLVVLALSTGCFAAVPLAPKRLFAASCLAIRVVQGLGSAMVETASFALCAELFREDLTAALGAIEVAVGAGWMLGPVFGGLLVELGGFEAPFLIMAAWVLLMAGLVASMIPARGAGGSVGGQEEEEAYGDVRVGQVLARPSQLAMLGVAVMANSAYSFTEPTLQPHVKLFVKSDSAVGALFFVCSITYAAVTPLVGILAKEPTPRRRDSGALPSAPGTPKATFGSIARRRSSSAGGGPPIPASFSLVRVASVAAMSTHGAEAPQEPPSRCAVGPVPVIIGGQLAIAIGYALIGPAAALGLPADSLALTAVAMAIIGLGQCAATLPLLDIMLIEAAELGPGAVGTLSGLLNSSYALGEMLGPLIGTNLKVQLGFAGATSVYALATLAYAPLLLCCWCPDKRRRAGSAEQAEASHLVA